MLVKPVALETVFVVDHGAIATQFLNENTVAQTLCRQAVTGGLCQPHVEIFRVVEHPCPKAHRCVVLVAHRAENNIDTYVRIGI